jgi:chloramphenicol-sensitive protein RarD
MASSDRTRSRQGVVYALAAYSLWGLIPLYFKSVARVAPPEVLAHRAFWSFVFLALLVGLLRRWGELWQKLHHGKAALILAASALLMALNWLTFIYAVQAGQVVQASLGYFITPLLTVLLGVVLLGERLRPYQVLSLLLAAAGMLVLTGLVGRFPWISLALALTMAFYGLLRKIVPVDSLLSVTVETLAMTPLALAYIGYLGATDTATGGGLPGLGLLMLSGPVTTVPLLFFGGAARRLRLSTMGFLQYLSPSLQFLLAVFAFGEPFSSPQVLSFACIWTAILIYTLDSLRSAQRDRVEVVEPD